MRFHFECYFPGLIIREETTKLDNKEFDENAKLPKRGRGAKQCGNKIPEQKYLNYIWTPGANIEFLVITFHMLTKPAETMYEKYWAVIIISKNQKKG